MRQKKFVAFLQKNPQVKSYMIDVARDVETAHTIFNRLAYVTKCKPLLSKPLQETISLSAAILGFLYGGFITCAAGYLVTDFVCDVVNLSVSPSKEKEAIKTLKKASQHYALSDDKEAELAKIQDVGFINYSMSSAAKCSMKI